LDGKLALVYIIIGSEEIIEIATPRFPRFWQLAAIFDKNAAISQRGREFMRLSTN